MNDVEVLLEVLGLREEVTGLTYTVQESKLSDDLELTVCNKLKNYIQIKAKARDAIEVLDKIELQLLRNAHKELEM